MDIKIQAWNTADAEAYISSMLSAEPYADNVASCRVLEKQYLSTREH